MDNATLSGEETKKTKNICLLINSHGVHMSLRCTFWNKITEIFDKIIAKIMRNNPHCEVQLYPQHLY